MLELKFAVCHRAASPSSQVSPVVVDELLLGICSNTELTMDDKASPCLHAHQPFFSSAILSNNCDLLLHALFTSEENSVANEP